ncbi:PQQ-binding-like beta-propeller repeat protein [Streptomyces sp. N2-109]|uniref:PQQ-binding-like beta-propeller repeat protein n=1 Tax=Streptomyces gossypii TaxID=2883101 RepID=A0ABT2JYA6_9ACTN|nr:PQQ-binding-like beta-propeller repeat protein [Streptomyces gossypii]MCT2592429.1 PQQ-binding-like beta-propeller repeat protein [Streptomyces gossypii]
MFAELEAGDPRQVGRYRIVARLGAGGMGRVFLGRSPGGRAMAVKVVREELAEDAGFRRRFAREVAAARRVTGVFTAAVVDADLEGSPAWLATEYVPGMSLGQAVVEHGAWPEAGVLALGAGLAEALEVIHAAGIVHRDLKPSNVLLAPDGPRVIDFGISVTDEVSVLTGTGMVIGTPGFMSPEQLASGGQVGPASDVFALGAVLAFAATTSGPFGTGAPHALHYRIVHEEPDLSGLPPVLGSVVARCLAKEPPERPAVGVLLEELAQALRDAGHEPSRLYSEHGWLPQPVALALHEQSSTGAALAPHRPLEQSAEEPGSAPGPAVAHDAPTRSGRAAGPDPAHPPTALGLPAPETTSVPPVPVLPPAPPPAVPSPAVPGAGGGPGRTRRQVLLAAAALGTAGIGFTGWRLLGGTGSESSGDSSGQGSGGNGARGRKVKGGTERWSIAGSTMPGILSVVDDAVYRISADGLSAFETATGRKRWTFPFPVEDVYPPPAVVDDTVYLGLDDKLHILDAATGQERRAPRIMGAGIWSLSAADGTLYVNVGERGLQALHPATGEELWTYPFSPDGEGGTHSLPVAADGTVYVFSGGRSDATLHAVDTSTGRKRWTHPANDAYNFLPAVASGDGTVYFPAKDDTLYAVDAVSGEQRWTFTTKGLPYGAFVADGMVYVHESEGSVYALDGTSGKQRWSFPFTGRVIPGAAVGDGTVCFSNKEGTLYALDAATGRKRWAFAPDSDTRFMTSPAIANGTAYIASGKTSGEVSYSLHAVAL